MPDIASVRHHILQDAEQAVTQDRNRAYGGPESSFRAIADLWNAYLQNRQMDPDVVGETEDDDDENLYVTATSSREKNAINETDVAIMLGLVKIARLAKNPSHYDSHVDLAGYAACAGEVAGAQRPK